MLIFMILEDISGQNVIKFIKIWVVLR